MGSATTFTFEEMTAMFGNGNPNSRQAMGQRAVQAKGGHCNNCEHCTKLTPIAPLVSGMKVRPDNFSVKVSCAIDLTRHKPFRREGSVREDCPARSHRPGQKVTINNTP